MLKTIETLQSSGECDLDSAVRAFEIANLGEQSADIEGFLPEENHPERAVILRKLIRLDMEFSWGRGTPRRVDEFRRVTPHSFRIGVPFRNWHSRNIACAWQVENALP